MRAHLSILLASILVLPVVVSGCRGREPLERVPQPNEGEGEGEGEPAVRTLGTRSLFGDMPTDNRVLDPSFGFAQGAWYGFTSDFRMAELLARQLPRTPTHYPSAIEVVASDRGAIVVGQVKTAEHPLAASVWIARDGDVDVDAFSRMDVSVVGVARDGTEVALALAADEASRVVLGEKTWLRFAGLINEGGIGWSMFTIYDGGNEGYLIHAPVVVDQGATPPGAAVRTAVRRKPTQLEHDAVAAAHARMRDHISAPSLRDPSPLPLPPLSAR